MSSTAYRLLAAKIVVALGALLVVILLGEGVARLFIPSWAPRTAAIAGFWAYDPELGWAHTPGARGTFRVFGRHTRVVINTSGFRDTERGYERTAATHRIVFIGDSMLWGYGVDQDEIFTALLQRQRPDLEAINLGVSGYGTDQELLLLRREGMRYRPDLVVVVVAPNDFQTNVQPTAYLTYHKPVFRLSPEGRLELTNTPVPTQSLWKRATGPLVRHSYLLNGAAVTYHTLTLSSGATRPSTAVAGGMNPFPSRATERVTVAMLLEMKALTERANAGLLVVLVERMGPRGRDMEQFLRARRVCVLNLEDEFGGEPPERSHLQDALHWNPAGHSRVADLLVRYLDGERLTAGRRMCP